MINSIQNPDADIFEIIVGATLDACGFEKPGNKLIGLAIIGLLGFALISMIAVKK